MPTTRVHRILDQVGTLAFAGVFDTLSAKLAQQVGFPDGLRLRLFRGCHGHRRARYGPAHADRDHRPGQTDLHERRASRSSSTPTPATATR